ncbi:MAG: alpha-amylase/4-alpha-glucanotransferase domain-containing protein, partial [Dehalococcoidia bacterium]
GERRRPLRVFDLDADGADEAVLTNDTLTLVVDPGDGGAIVELSDRTRAINLVDTLARRPEAYHAEGADAPPYDRGRRGLFVDRFLAADGPPARDREIADQGDFRGRPYAMHARRAAGGLRVTLDRTAAAPGGAARVEKRIDIPGHGGAIDVRYTVEATSGRVDARFGIECNFGIFFQQQTRGAVTVGDRTLGLRRGGAGRGVDRCIIALEEPEIAVTITSDLTADVDVRPVDTISQSEKGLERTSQALACLFSWPVALAPGERFTAGLRLAVDGGSRGGA